jgi:TPR repeat protein
MWSIAELHRRWYRRGSREYYEKAAALGDRNSIYEVGRHYIIKDRSKAREYFRRAAELGHRRSMWALGMMEQATNLGEAGRWWSKGAALGDENCTAGLRKIQRLESSRLRMAVFTIDGRIVRTLGRLLRRIKVVA